MAPNSSGGPFWAIFWPSLTPPANLVQVGKNWKRNKLRSAPQPQPLQKGISQQNKSVSLTWKWWWWWSCSALFLFSSRSLLGRVLALTSLFRCLLMQSSSPGRWMLLVDVIYICTRKVQSTFKKITQEAAVVMLAKYFQLLRWKWLGTCQ